MFSLKQTVKWLIALAVYYGGVLAIFRRWRAPVVRILAYHAVNDELDYLNLFVSPSKFRKQMQHLARHYRTVNMHGVEDVLDRDGPEQDLVAVTLDDGYRDNLDQAFPIAQSEGIPLTIYLATGYVDTGRPTFILSLILAVHYARKEFLDLSHRGLGIFNLRSHAEREEAIRRVDHYAKGLSFSEQQKLLDEITKSLDTSGNDLFSDRMLAWDEVRKLSKIGVCFGGHTVTHPVLSCLDPREVEGEIQGSQQRIREELGQVPSTFAYPYGGREDVGQIAEEVVRRSEYRSAVMLYPNRVESQSRYRLGRMMVGEEMTSGPLGGYSEAVFACEVAGFFEALLKRQ